MKENLKALGAGAALLLLGGAIGWFGMGGMVRLANAEQQLSQMGQAMQGFAKQTQADIALLKASQPNTAKK